MVDFAEGQSSKKHTHGRLGYGSILEKAHHWSTWLGVNSGEITPLVDLAGERSTGFPDGYVTRTNDLTNAVGCGFLDSCS
jgi:hypothetical protein